MSTTLPKDDSPGVGKTAFICPHCKTKTTQYWHEVYLEPIADSGTPLVLRTDTGNSGFLRWTDAPPWVVELDKPAYAFHQLNNAFVSICMECEEFALWFGSRILVPRLTLAPAAIQDMPEEVKADYEEAGRILALSPRGAAALLRLAVEKLCIHLGYTTGSINAKIKKMVEDGLPHEVERALDVVRVVGNGAVHPGHLDLKDDQETATKLFGIVNYIVMDRITRPNELAKMFDTKVTDGQKAEIAKRRKPEDSAS